MCVQTAFFPTSAVCAFFPTSAVCALRFFCGGSWETCRCRIWNTELCNPTWSTQESQQKWVPSPAPSSVQHREVSEIWYIIVYKHDVHNCVHSCCYIRVCAYAFCNCSLLFLVNFDLLDSSFNTIVFILSPGEVCTYYDCMWYTIVDNIDVHNCGHRCHQSRCVS